MVILCSVVFMKPGRYWLSGAVNCVCQGCNLVSSYSKGIGLNPWAKASIAFFVELTMLLCRLETHL